MMLTVIILFATLYLMTSVVIAFHRISRGRRYESAIQDAPYGDIEYYYKKPVLFDSLTTIFYPAQLIIIGWIKIIHMINHIING